MPNWCENKLTVSGPKEKVKEFDQKFKGKGAKWNVESYMLRGLNEEEKAKAIKNHEKRYDNKPLGCCFDALYPVPQEIIDRGYSNSGSYNFFRDPYDENRIDGYFWCISHWGTKWDISYNDVVGEEVESENPENLSMVYAFETAWAPPRPWVMKVSKDFPDLTFSLKFAEPGINFAGHYEYEKGEAVLADDYDSSIESYRAFAMELLGYDPLEEEEEEEEEEKEEEKEEGTKRDLTITISGDEVAVLKAQREIREEVFQLTGKYPDEEKKEDSDG